MSAEYVGPLSLVPEGDYAARIKGFARGTCATSGSPRWISVKKWGENLARIQASAECSVS